MNMNSIDSLTLEVADLAGAQSFYARVFGLGDRLRLRESDAATTGFRGFTVSLIVTQPADARLLLDEAIAAGATVLKPAAKSLWGFGGSVQAPDGTVWNIATSSKKDTKPAGRAIENIVLLLDTENVAESKRFYTDLGFSVKKSFGSYVDFDTPEGSIGLGLYKRAALAKSAGIASDGGGSHRLVINGTSAGATDPDGFVWAA